MRTKNAFTLVELLVVIAIIGILVGILLPAVQMVREAARRTTCANNLHQIVTALHNYESSNQHFPKGFIAKDAIFKPGWAWTSQILSFLDQGNLQAEIDFSIDIRSVPVDGVRTETFQTLLCSSSPTKSNPVVALPDLLNPDDPFMIGRSHYVGSVGGKVEMHLMENGEF